MISVVIPLYNKEEYIYETIQRVLSQTFQQFEIVVVNDGSTDKSVDILRSIDDRRIRLIEKENGGVSSARNRGIKEAKFDYIAFLDADDEWLPNHLEEINRLIQQYGDTAAVFVTNFARRYPNGDIISNRTPEELTDGIVDNYFRIVNKKALIHTSCVCITKGSLIATRMFDERISRGEDMDLWMRISKIYKIAYSKEVTEIYLQNAKNNSKRRFDVAKSSVFYLTFSDISDNYERQIKRKLLYRKYASLLLKEFDWTGFFKLFYKMGIK